jgi:hypothetical protein
MTDLNKLIQSVYDYFQKKYGVDTGSLGPGSLFLAFDKLATNLSVSDFKSSPTDKEINSAVALQHGSDLVNFVAQLDSEGFVAPRGDLSPSIDEQYSLLISASQYHSQSAADNAAALFLELKGQALRKFDESKMNMNLTDFWPASFTPQFWFNDQDPTIWSTYSTATSSESGTPSPTPTVPPKVKLGDWRWRVITPEAAPKLQTVRQLQAMPASVALNTAAMRSLAAEPLPAATRAVPGPSATMTMSPKPVSLTSKAPVSKPAATVLSARPSLAANVAVLPKPQVARVSPLTAKNLALSNVVLNLPAQPVSSSNFELSFRYCLVTFSRPWLSATFLNAANWYIPGLQSGDCGSGKYESSALPFAFLPAKFIVVKDLNITAQWSEEDRKYINNSASFGPFWVEKESNSNTLKHPGMQILAWLCQVMPVLPPVSDPGAPAAAPAPTG